MTKPNTTYFFEDKPLFGLDVGRGSIRVMQIDPSGSKPRVIGYGTAEFDPSAVDDGVIVQPEVIAKSTQDLFRHHLVGDITTRRVAIALPVACAFTRSMYVPSLSAKETEEAVQTEAEQYIPMPLNDIYIDYSRTKSRGDSSELFVVAMPKRIVDSYLTLTRLMGLEAVLFETSVGACAELFSRDQHSDVPSILIDFGTLSADVTVYHDGITLSSTVACGGEQITDLIRGALNVTSREANIIKTKYGLGVSKKQSHIENALSPLLGLLMKEVRRTIRYYEERLEKKLTIGQIVITGGGANMPGLADYLTNNLRLPVRALDPSSHLQFGRLQPFAATERMSYVTVAGLSMVRPAEIFA